VLLMASRQLITRQLALFATASVSRGGELNKHSRRQQQAELQKVSRCEWQVQLQFLEALKSAAGVAKG